MPNRSMRGRSIPNTSTMYNLEPTVDATMEFIPPNAATAYLNVRRCTTTNQSIQPGKADRTRPE